MTYTIPLYLYVYTYTINHTNSVENSDQTNQFKLFSTVDKPCNQGCWGKRSAGWGPGVAPITGALGGRTGGWEGGGGSGVP